MSYKVKPQLKIFKFENNSFKQLAIIDDYLECSWERNLYEAGQFSVTINFNIPNSQYFQKGLFIQFGNDSYDFGIITKVNDVIDENGKGGQIRNITGFDARYIFKSRVIKNLNNNGVWECTSKAEYCLRKLIQDQCGVSCFEEKRKLPVKNVIKMSDAWNSNVIASSIGFRGVCYSKDKNLFVAVGTNATIYTSPDGINWTQRISNTGIYQLDWVIYSEEKELFVVDSYFGTILTSPDGITWTERSTGLPQANTSNLWGMMYSNKLNLFVTVGFSGTILTSPDGVNWTSQNISTSTLRSICYSEKLDLFVIVGNGGTILTSSDLQNWTERSSGISSVIWNIQFIKNKFIAVGYGGVILTSSDGITWTQITSGISNNLYSIDYIESLNLFLITGNSGTILTSSDGITWTQISSGVSNNLISYCYSEKLGLLGIVGSSGITLTNKDSEAVSNIGNECTVSESFSNLYEVCRTIATQNEIGWRLHFDGKELSLECYEGTDRSSSVQFSPSFDSLRDGNFTDSLENFINSVYVGGKGDNDDRDLYEGESLVDNESPSGLDRFESYDNQSQLTTEDEYKNQADSILTQYAQNLAMSGNGLASCPYIYKEQYDVGDKIKFSFSNKTTNVRILSVTEHWSWGNYEISFSFGKPENTLTEQLQLILRKIQKASNKTAAVESVRWYEIPNNNFMPADDVTFNTIGFTGNVGTGFTFRFYLDDQNTGSKIYNVYMKNLSGTGKLILTTGKEGAEDLELSVGDYIGMIYVDTEGNISSVSASHANTADSANTAITAETATSATTAETANSATNATNSENANVSKTSRMNDIIIADNEPTTSTFQLSIPGFTVNDLVAGKRITVLFNKCTSTSSLYININSTGSKTLRSLRGGTNISVPYHYGYWRGSSSRAAERWQDNTILDLVYNGSAWLICGNPVLENYDTYTTGEDSYRVYADGKVEVRGQDTAATHTLAVEFSDYDMFTVVASTNNDRGSATYDREKYRNNGSDGSTLIKTGTYNCSFYCVGY